MAAVAGSFAPGRPPTWLKPVDWGVILLGVLEEEGEPALIPL